MSSNAKGPDSSNATWMNMSSSECEQACLSNCNCTAFFSMNIDGKGTGCLAWYGELMYISVTSDEGWAINVRVDATELGSLLCLLEFLVNFHLCLFLFLGRGLMTCFLSSATYTRKSKSFLGNKRKLTITILSVAVPLFLVSMLAYMWLKIGRAHV